jgi:predicted DNA binding CopG/RHH family protein
MRIPVCIRMEEKDLRKIDKRAEKCGLIRAELLRAVLHEFAYKQDSGFELRHGGK